MVENYVNLFDVQAASGNGCGYAVAYVKSPAARKAILNAGTIGGFKAWLNGKQVDGWTLRPIPVRWSSTSANRTRGRLERDSDQIDPALRLLGIHVRHLDA